jgi:sortase (surface protein transpeptidase)
VAADLHRRSPVPLGSEPDELNGPIMRTTPRRAAALTVAIALTACAADAPSTADPPSTDPSADELHLHHQRGDGDGGEDGGPAPRTTEQTLAAMRAIDPARLASLHDHGGQQHRQVAHPNGVTPERLVVPAIGVDADVVELGVQEDGTMEVPTDFAQTGWFRPGPRPGRVGPAVIAGHVDDRSGPAVFSRLAELEAGDRIEVHGEGGELVVFEVRRSEQHPKDAFPTEGVYGGTPGPELRLITCAGAFDRQARSYRDNVIVYAERVDP